MERQVARAIPTSRSPHAAPLRSLTLVVEGIWDAIAVEAGEAHTCVSHSKGKASCWGDGLCGRLGNGNPNDVQTRPVAALWPH